MLGIDVARTTVAKYMVRHRRPPSPSWQSFIRGHLDEIVAMDFFTVPTVRNQVLYVFLVLSLKRRRILHFNVAENPTAAWTAQQIVEAFAWETPPRFLQRDRDDLRRVLSRYLEYYYHGGRKVGSTWMRRTGGGFRECMKVESSRYPRSSACTTTTNVGLPEVFEPTFRSSLPG
jgi:hypothetical protein